VDKYSYEKEEKELCSERIDDVESPYIGETRDEKRQRKATEKRERADFRKRLDSVIHDLLDKDFKCRL